LIVRSHRVVTAGAIRPASVHIRGGKIVGVLPFNDVPPGCPVDEGGDAAVMPGVVDTHVHIPAPGSRDWDGLEPTTRAAAAGGVTTLLDMPSHRSPATTTAHGVRVKRDAAEGKFHVDVGLWGGVVPGNERELAPMVEAGVLGFKCALMTSGADDYPAVSDADLRIAMPAIAKLGVPRVHELSPAENALPESAPRVLGALADAPIAPPLSGVSRVSSGGGGAPRSLMIGLCRELPAIHILPLILRR
jgi:allantoinase